MERRRESWNGDIKTYADTHELVNPPCVKRVTPYVMAWVDGHFIKGTGPVRVIHYPAAGRTHRC